MAPVTLLVSGGVRGGYRVALGRQGVVLGLVLAVVGERRRFVRTRLPLGLWRLALSLELGRQSPEAKAGRLVLGLGVILPNTGLRSTVSASQTERRVYAYSIGFTSEGGRWGSCVRGRATASTKSWSGFARGGRK